VARTDDHDRIRFAAPWPAQSRTTSLARSALLAPFNCIFQLAMMYLSYLQFAGVFGEGRRFVKGADDAVVIRLALKTSAAARRTSRFVTAKIFLSFSSGVSILPASSSCRRTSRRAVPNPPGPGRAALGVLFGPFEFLGRQSRPHLAQFAGRLIRRASRTRSLASPAWIMMLRCPGKA